MGCTRILYVQKGKNLSEPVKVPCGHCLNCRLERARQWAVRCVHEASLHDENSFITLTYNKEHLPKDMSVRKSEMQDFMRKLRYKYAEKKIRFYGCGEYGEKLGRPHYHICLFGIDFDDKVLLYKQFGHKRRFKVGFDFSLYTSKKLEDVWSKGFVTIGELNSYTAGYTARYCMKRITGLKAAGHYNGRLPEFALMSRKPGIAYEWFKNFKGDVYPKDFFTIRGKRQKPPRFYDYLLEKAEPELLKKIKEKREDNIKESVHGLRLRQMEKYKELVIKNLKRNLEND